MQVDEKLVMKIAHLARLHIEDEFIPVYAEKLTKILDLFDQIGNVNTDGIEPMQHAQELSQPLAEDTVREVNQRDKLQASAPSTKAGLYLVPKVID